MGNLSDAEGLELSLAQLTLMDAQFQYWLSVTFAVLVAAFVAGARLSSRWRAWIALLYLLVSVLFVVRFAGSALYATALAEELTSRGVPSPGIGATAAVLLRSTIFLSGLVTTMLFLFLKFPKGKYADESLD